jgi:tRNA pseudouridine55 synthase
MKEFGLLIIDKPVGPTSHSVVNMVRRGTGIRKVGHAGTLDPRASGVLVLCLGSATRLSEYLSTSDKTYRATVRFGASTRTYDADGEITRQTGLTPTRPQVMGALAAFTGILEQTPPPFSAIKVKGRKAYELARNGTEIELEPRQIRIYSLEIVSYSPPDLELSIRCSAGTYIRSLAHDLGEKLGCGAYLAALKRVQAGPFTLESATPMPMLEVGFLTGKWEQYVRPAADALPDLPVVMLTREMIEQVKHGHRFPAAPGSQGLARALDPEGELAAILEADVESGEWHPRKVFIG